MTTGITEAIASLAKKVTDALEQIITVRVQFEELRRYTRETIDEYKRLLERAEDRIERVERERVGKEAELRAKIDALSARLDALSEAALHAAIQKMASDVVSARLQQSAVQQPVVLPGSESGNPGKK